MQYSQNFYTNVALFVLALVVLGLSIWAFVAPCKKDTFENNNNCKYCKNYCPARGKSVTSVKNLSALNDICTKMPGVDCTNLGTIYVDTNWACNNTGEPADTHPIN